MSLSLPERVAQAEASGDRTPAQLALLIRQRVALDQTVPPAIALLQSNPLIDAENYPGDLLSDVLKVPGDFWTANQDLWSDAHGILQVLDMAMKNIQPAKAAFLGMK